MTGKFLKRFSLPVLVAAFAAMQTVGSPIQRIAPTLEPGLITDTIVYDNPFKRLSRTSDEFNLIDSSALMGIRDTIKVPDSLSLTDPFRYKWYVATVDSLTHTFVRDSLRAAGDSVIWPRIDSIYTADSTMRAKKAFEQWYNSLDKMGRKRYLGELKAKREKALADSVMAVKDSLKAIKDSIREETPRILETFALPDSMQYRRIVTWTHDRRFHKIGTRDLDTNYNFRYNDYPFLQQDVNATWLGVAGSAVQTYNYFKRGDGEGVSFYAPYESWSKSASSIPLYNTKMPYTELAYWGTLFANDEKASDNLHIMTTQNLYPSLNFTLQYDRFGGNGMLLDETTKNKNFYATVNYLGKKYMLNAGYIYNGITRKENGGIKDNYWIRDTTVEVKEVEVIMNSANTEIKKNTLFLDQQYRIPLNFIGKLFAKNSPSDSTRQADTLSLNRNITTAFIGHSTEYSTYRKLYTDQIATSDSTARRFFNDNFFYHPTSAHDSVRTMRLENRLFLRLQPWAEDGIVSKLNVGLGNRIQSFYMLDPSFITKSRNERWNSSFLYGGVEGQLQNYIKWDAVGEFVFSGDEAGDFSVEANAGFSFRPFRKARTSPVDINLHFETSLKEPDFYHQHYFSNHFKWDNDFGKTSVTRLQGSIAVPYWNLLLTAGYTLLDNNIYFDETGMVRQNSSPMHIASVSLTKNFSLAHDLIHLDNRLLFQVSSDKDVVPLPALAANLRYYIQFNIVRNVLQIQMGANGFCNTSWYSPGWNPAVGTFYNQNQTKYNNGPIIDAFVNMQWKRACIFVKMENVGMGWPMEKADYFTAHHYIRTPRALKLGMYWPFYMQSNPVRKMSDSASGNSAH